MKCFLLLACLSATLFNQALANFEGKFPGKGSVGIWKEADALADRADKELNKSKYAEAERLYRIAIKMYSDDAAFYYGLGQCLNAEGRYKEAANLFSKSVKLEPTLNNWGELGNAYTALGRYKDGKQAYIQASKLAKTSNERHLVEKNLLELERRAKQASK